MGSRDPTGKQPDAEKERHHGNGILVITRKVKEVVYIGESISITVVDIDRNKVKLGVVAPREVPIWRKEIKPDNSNNNNGNEINVATED